MILASGSPRRKEILENLGFHLEMIAPDIEEKSDKKNISARIMEIACQKATAVAKKFPDHAVIGADTVVVLNHEMIGKPKNAEDAFQTLQKLSGREHQVLTAFSFQNVSKGICICDFELTSVIFYPFHEALVHWYVNTGEPMDKAGSYGIQGKGAILVKKIKGDFFNVMGFPAAKFIRKIMEIGIKMDEIPFL
jgi:septum formation protein